MRKRVDLYSPLPPLQPAVFPPSLPEPPAAPLELFDLDEHFSSATTRLNALTSKCSGTTDEDELAYYITECASILGVTALTNTNTNNSNNHIHGNSSSNNVLSSSKHAVARNLLTSIFTQIAKWKMPQNGGGSREDDDLIQNGFDNSHNAGNFVDAAPLDSSVSMSLSTPEYDNRNFGM